jgi:hypothetical protein
LAKIAENCDRNIDPDVIFEVKRQYLTAKQLKKEFLEIYKNDIYFKIRSWQSSIVGHTEFIQVVSYYIHISEYGLRGR